MLDLKFSLTGGVKWRTKKGKRGIRDCGAASELSKFWMWALQFILLASKSILLLIRRAYTFGFFKNKSTIQRFTQINKLLFNIYGMLILYTLGHLPCLHKVKQVSNHLRTNFGASLFFLSLLSTG